MESWTSNITRCRHSLFVATLLTVFPLVVPKAIVREDPDIKVVSVGNGIRLHYVERGHGEPVIFVHGSLGDGSYWNNELEFFGRQFHALAYSRRHNMPNDNPNRPGYSAIADAGDLAALIRALRLGPVHVVGHSYGALTALFLGVSHPELVRTLVLAEAPAMSLLDHAEGPNAARARSTFEDIQRRMVEPMKAAFARGDREAGMAVFINYVFDNPDAWNKMPATARADTLRNAHEWDLMLTTGRLFPELPPDAVRRITAPALLLSGDRSYPFLHLIDEDLLRLLPHARQVVITGAGHQMWLQQPDVCRNAVLDFWRAARQPG
jgi:pimeloyl-ACP methyl ester carboxylesterase